MPTSLITGGTSGIGKATAQLLHARGHRVAVTGRNLETIGAVFRPVPVTDVTEELFDESVDINFKGQYFTLQKALPLLADGGSVVLTVGLGATRGAPGATLGAASRQGLGL